MSKAYPLNEFVHDMCKCIVDVNRAIPENHKDATRACAEAMVAWFSNKYDRGISPADRAKGTVTFIDRTETAIAAMHFLSDHYDSLLVAGLVQKVHLSILAHIKVYEALLALPSDEVYRRSDEILAEIIDDARRNPDAWADKGRSGDARMPSVPEQPKPQATTVLPLHSTPAPGGPLLYDAVVDHLHRVNAPAGLLSAMRRIPIFELTDVLPVLVNWKAEQGKPIHRRPPSERVWCEWRIQSSPENRNQCVLSVGAYVRKCNEETFAAMKAEAAAEQPDPTSGNPVGRIAMSEEMCSVELVVRLDRWSGPDDPPFPRGKIVRAGWSFLVYMGDDSTWSEIRQCQLGRSDGTFPEFEFADLANCGTAFDPSIAIAAFALLHCKNVGRVEIPAAPTRNPERRAKQGLPPHRAHWVLRIDVPSARRASADGGGIHASPRYHSVRGHFVRMMDERYRRRGETYWREEHMSGDPTLGEIDKTYSVETKPPPNGTGGGNGDTVA